MRRAALRSRVEAIANARGGSEAAHRLALEDMGKGTCRDWVETCATEEYHDLVAVVQHERTPTRQEYENNPLVRHAVRGIRRAFPGGGAPRLLTPLHRDGQKMNDCAANVSAYIEAHPGAVPVRTVKLWVAVAGVSEAGAGGDRIIGVKGVLHIVALTANGKWISPSPEQGDDLILVVPARFAAHVSDQELMDTTRALQMDGFVMGGGSYTRAVRQITDARNAVTAPLGAMRQRIVQRPEDVRLLSLPGVFVAQSAVHGAGLFARKSFNTGDTVLRETGGDVVVSEDTLVRFRPGTRPRDRRAPSPSISTAWCITSMLLCGEAARTWVDDLAVNAHMVRRCMQDSPDKALCDELALAYPCQDVPLVFGRVVTNHFHVGGISSLGRQTSRANHRDAANVAPRLVSWSHGHRAVEGSVIAYAMELVALRKLLPGEELFISYPFDTAGRFV